MSDAKDIAFNSGVKKLVWPPTANMKLCATFGELGARTH